MVVTCFDHFLRIDNGAVATDMVTLVVALVES